MVHLWLGSDTKHVIEKEVNARMLRTPDMQSLTEQGDQLVFVYGTLKKGFHNHRVLGNNPTYLGKGRTQDIGWLMYDTGGFPVVMKTAHTGNYIYGEIYSVPPTQMIALDGLEANGTMYQRKKVAVRFLEQKEESDVFKGHVVPIRPVWMYVGMPNYWDDRTNLSLIERKPVTLDSGLGQISGAFYRSF